MAYKYEFGEDIEEGAFFGNNSVWYSIRKHRSLLDYYIAYYYCTLLDRLDIEKDYDELTFAFFDMVLPKNITRFIISTAKSIDCSESLSLAIISPSFE